MLDSGPLISLYDRTDPRRSRVVTELEAMHHRKYPVCTTLLTIAETHRRILYDVDHSRALTFLNDIYDGSVNILTLQTQDEADAKDIIARYADQRISCTDAITMAVMKRIGIQKVLSYDHHFWVLNFHVMQL